MARNRDDILGNPGDAVMIVVVRVRNVLAVNVIHFDIKAVGLDPRVVDAIEIVEGAVGNACLGVANSQEQSADAKNCE